MPILGTEKERLQAVDVFSLGVIIHQIMDKQCQYEVLMMSDFLCQFGFAPLDALISMARFVLQECTQITNILEERQKQQQPVPGTLSSNDRDLLGLFCHNVSNFLRSINKYKNTKIELRDYYQVKNGPKILIPPPATTPTLFIDMLQLDPAQRFSVEHYIRHLQNKPNVRLQGNMTVAQYFTQKTTEPRVLPGRLTYEQMTQPGIEYESKTEAFAELTNKIQAHRNNILNTIMQTQ
jgi:hypothetical protein